MMHVVSAVELSSPGDFAVDPGVRISDQYTVPSHADLPKHPARARRYSNVYAVHPIAPASTIGEEACQQCRTKGTQILGRQVVDGCR
jgi:hypothetical protein